MSIVEIHRLELRYRTPSAMRSQLDELAVRMLPAALEEALGGVDDGRIIVLRRVEARVRLGRPPDPAFVTAWAKQLAQSIEQAMRQARPEPSGDVAAFPDAISALSCYVSDAMARRQDAWWWREGGALSLVRRTLAAVPGPARSLGPPPPPHEPAGVAIGWALQMAGAALPRLVQLLSERREGIAAIGALSAQQAEQLLAQIDLRPETEITAADGRSFQPLAALAAATPLVVSEARDPRNILLIGCLALELRPALRSARGFRQAIEVSLEQSSQDPRLRSSAPHALASSPLAPAVSLPDAAPDALAVPECSVGGAPTSFGGLLFLIDPLYYLQVPVALLEEPLLAENPGCPPVLYLVLCILAPQSFADPAALWLAGLDTPTVPEVPIDEGRAAAVLRADARIRSAAAALPFRLLPEDEAVLRAQAARVPLKIPAWLAELCLRIALCVVGYLRARVELDENLPLPALLPQICAKSGRLVRTRTHLDLYMPLDSADLVVRKAGLDVNPGWVPVIGLVVNFHYD